MSIRDIEVSVSLCHAIITCKLLSQSTYDEFKRQTGVKSHIANQIVNKVMEKVRID